MDLVCTVYAPKKTDSNSFPHRSKWYYESGTLCDVSAQNVLAFVSSYPLDAWNGSESLEDTYSLPPYKSKMGDRGHSAGAFSHHATNGPDDGSYVHRVYVCDLNTPWDVRLITSKTHEITCISWDSDFSNTFVIADKSGQVEIWQSREDLISEWRCIFDGRTEFSGEVFLSAKFLSRN